MPIKLQQQENLAGDNAVAAQGFGRISKQRPPSFDPQSEHDAACSYFADNGFVVLNDCLNASDLDFLNQFYSHTQLTEPGAWGLGERRKPHHRNQGLIFSQPLLDHPELDAFTRHPGSFGVVSSLLGGEQQVRFSEFNFRETPANAGVGTMNFHHDEALADRLVRRPYMPCDWLCAIHYLTDVEPGTPSFCVVPRSNTFETLKEAFAAQGDDYEEVPLYGAAGTCILYDTATFHTRLDGDGVRPRRTWHQYYARGGWLPSALPTTNKYIRAPAPALTNWNLFPERLALHPDTGTRRFFSHWNTAQGEWVASGFDPLLRKSMPRGEQ